VPDDGGTVYDPNMGMRWGLAVLAVLALALTGCSYPSAEPAADDWEDWGINDEMPNYTDAELMMLRMGADIDGIYGLDTDDETWLSVQAGNCRVARSLNGRDPSEVSWYLPPGPVRSDFYLLDEDSLLGASVAISLVSGCFDTIDYGWRWPRFWGTIYALGGGGDIGDGGGYRVRCEDGTYSNAGGVQGACSWHGGVDD